MASRYVRSVFWLCTFTGLGYGLLVLTSPSKEDTENLRKKLPGVERNSKEVVHKSQQFTNILQTATENKKPFYRLTQVEIEREIKK